LKKISKRDLYSIVAATLRRAGLSTNRGAVILFPPQAEFITRNYIPQVLNLSALIIIFKE